MSDTMPTSRLLVALAILFTYVGCQDPSPTASDDASGDTTSVADAGSSLDADGAADTTTDASDVTTEGDGGHHQLWRDTGYPTDCTEDLTNDEMIDCAKQEFWRVFQVDFDDRSSTYETLTAVIEELESLDNPPTDELATLYFRRGQLGLALVAEQQEVKKLGTLIPDFERAVELKPDYDIVPPLERCRRPRRGLTRARRTATRRVTGTHLAPSGTLPAGKHPLDYRRDHRAAEVERLSPGDPATAGCMELRGPEVVYRKHGRSPLCPPRDSIPPRRSVRSDGQTREGRTLSATDARGAGGRQLAVSRAPETSARGHGQVHRAV